MPLYEYYCADCQAKFDALRPMNKADETIQCKNCESTHTSRTLSLFVTHNKTEHSTACHHGEGVGCGGGCCGGGKCGCKH